MLKPNEDGSELIRLPNSGRWAMYWDGMEIVNPAWSECRFFVSPAYYGFFIHQTGGGCTAWAKKFGTWLVLVTDDTASHELQIGHPVTIGVYDDQDNWAVWEMDEDGYVQGSYHHEGELA